MAASTAVGLAPVIPAPSRGAAAARTTKKEQARPRRPRSPPAARRGAAGAGGAASATTTAHAGTSLQAHATAHGGNGLAVARCRHGNHHGDGGAIEASSARRRTPPWPRESSCARFRPTRAAWLLQPAPPRRGRPSADAVASLVGLGLQAVASETGAPAAGGAAAILTANSNIKAAFGCSPVFFATGELGRGHSSKATGSGDRHQRNRRDGGSDQADVAARISVAGFYGGAGDRDGGEPRHLRSLCRRARTFSARPTSPRRPRPGPGSATTPCILARSPPARHWLGPAASWRWRAVLTETLDLRRFRLLRSNAPSATRRARTPQPASSSRPWPVSAGWGQARLNRCPRGPELGHPMLAVSGSRRPSPGRAGRMTLLGVIASGRCQAKFTT